MTDTTGEAGIIKRRYQI